MARLLPPTQLTHRGLVVWRYLSRTATRRHALPINTSPVGHSGTALCGRFCWDTAGWLGSGTQNEHDRCEQLPECQQCADRLTLKEGNR